MNAQATSAHLEPMTITPALAGHYGEGPTALGSLDLSAQWHEFMHYLYLPVRIPEPGSHDVFQTLRDRVPPNLRFLVPAIRQAIYDARATTEHLGDPYVYVTARRGFATPGNPLNRPGVHTDDFGGTDLNYIWTDRYPTRFIRSSTPLTLPDDDATSMDVMATLASSAQIEDERWRQQQIMNGNAPRPSLWLEHGPVNTLLRLTPYVIHDTPLIPEPGGMRSFFKISVSTHRYDLLGNSHNHALAYDWPMTDRQALRNQPQGTKDYTEATR